MRKVIFFFSIVLTLGVSGTNAQGLIAVQNGGNPSFFTDLQTSIDSAQNGDTVYISGGIYNCDLSIDKSVHLVGVGFNLDSCISTLNTKIIGSITVSINASNGSITGVFLLDGDIYLNDSVHNYLIKRCSFSNLLLGQSNNSYNSNIIIIENIIKYINGKFLTDSYFLNNIVVNNLINIGNNCIIRNNIFHSGYYSNPNNYTVSDLYNSIIENNIFINAPTVLTIYNGINCIIRNNMYSENTIWYIYCPGCTILNNLISYNIYDIFYNGFHLNPLSPGINAGTDGTDIGIYGGLYSWKDGSIPFNPHIQQKTISGTTDQNGNLNVNIKVEAQDN